MKVVIQRVKWARVRAGEVSTEIGPGMVVLAGLEREDTEEVTAWVAAKLASLRIFEDASGRMNLGLEEVGGAILAISQFTLAGSIQKGRRPGFDSAMPPDLARSLFNRFLEQLQGHHPQVKAGFFQEHMEVELLNDGPVTFILER